MDVERIYCAEQIVVPPELPEIIKVFTKEVIRANPADLDEFGAQCAARRRRRPPTPCDPRSPPRGGPLRQVLWRPCRGGGL